ncbi:MAG TPA: hypothetical protein DIT32_03575 [Peptococcaceae bacterium]|nr:hypothetical protein [Peptococcaceae bacterium]
MEIKKKSIIGQLFCRHQYREGLLSKRNAIPLFNLSGETYTTICCQCGKIKGTRFVRSADGS